MRLHHDAKTDLIAGVPLFVRCSRKETQRIASISTEIDMAAGKVLIHEREYGSEFFVLVEGTVDVTRGGELVATLGPGDYVGEIALLENTPRNATVTASSPVRALVLNGREFWALLDTAPAIQRKLLGTLAERLAPTAL